MLLGATCAHLLYPNDKAGAYTNKRREWCYVLLFYSSKFEAKNLLPFFNYASTNEQNAYQWVFFFYLGALWGQGCLAGIAVPHVDMCRWGRFNQKKKKQEERSSQAIGPRKGWAYGYPHSSPPCCFEHAFSPGSEGTEMCLVLPRGGLHTQIWNTVAQTFGSSNRYWKSTRREI